MKEELRLENYNHKLHFFHYRVLLEFIRRKHHKIFEVVSFQVESQVKIHLKILRRKKNVLGQD